MEAEVAEAECYKKKRKERENEKIKTEKSTGGNKYGGRELGNRKAD